MADRIRRENPPPRRCGARNRAGSPCKRWAIPGAIRCKLHGAYAGRGGRARAKEIHTARRIESLVTDFASRAMIEAGFPVEVVRMAGGSLPAPDPDEESTPSLTDDDEEAALNSSMARLAENLIARFQDVAVELARQQAQEPAPGPEVIDGEAVDSGAAQVTQEPAPAAQEPAPETAERDPVAERVETLERRPTAGRMAEAARLRRPREVVTHHFGDGKHLPEPEPDPEPAQELTVKRQPDPQRGPRRDAKGRIVTTLGSRPDDRIGSYRNFH